MVLLESINIALGTKMSDFVLKKTNDTLLSLDEAIGERGILVCFTCNHCPYAIAIWDRVIKLSEYAKLLGINTVAINPNIHPDYPEDSPNNMDKLIEKLNIPFPYLVDDTQTVAKSWKAQCTPDLYLLNSKKELVYHGRLDDNWKDPSNLTSEDLKIAITNLSKNESVSKIQFPSMGCSIKWLQE